MATKEFYKATVIHEGKRLSLMHIDLPPELVVEYSYPDQWVEAPVGGLFVCNSPGEAFSEGGYGTEVWKVEAEDWWEQEGHIPFDFDSYQSYLALWQQGIMPKRRRSLYTLPRVHLLVKRLKLVGFVGVQPWDAYFPRQPNVV